MNTGHWRKFRFRRRFTDDFDAHQLGDNYFTQVCEQGLKQFEAFGLVLVERIALSIATETDD
ncbi:hypothetical protein D9M72_637070 [compost metagenome]